ncbi:MAG: DUF4388 domain-containing protein [Candidatus Zixiibacteriota bacterium]|nr:MAG: DUF4388 domain-containing protein [candidate division Zixibacteria bacterium]
MKSKQSGRRLDQILISEELVNEAQVREVLEYQKEHGGKLGSNLLRFGYVSEAGLLKALETQFGSPSVELGSLDIHEIVIKFVPASVARARKVVPFDYDPENNILKVACENPTDDQLVQELDFVARGKKVQLFVALEVSIRAAIAKYYVSVSEDENNTEVGHKETTQDTGSVAPGSSDSPLDEADISAFQEDRDIIEPPRGSVLLVADESESDELLKKALELDCYKVSNSASVQEAMDQIGNKHFDVVFIRDTISGDYLDLIDRLRKISPGTRVRYYENMSNFLVRDAGAGQTADLLVTNLDLFTSLLASRDNLPTNHAGRVGQYVNRLCGRLGLADEEKTAIINAAYLHDIAAFYYGQPGEAVPGDVDRPSEDHDVIKLSARLLDSLNVPPLVVGILEAMYKNLRGRYTDRMPIEVLGGNLVTAADLYCESVPPDGKISVKQYELIKERFAEQVGSLFLKEVADAFLEIIHEEMLSTEDIGKYSQVMILGTSEDEVSCVETRLKEESYRMVCPESIEAAVELFDRSRPDFLIMAASQPADEVRQFVESVLDSGLTFSFVTTFLLVNSDIVAAVTGLLEEGIEDIIALDANLELLVVKMKRVRAQREKESSELTVFEQNSVAHGSLSDMNLLDLLQTMAPSGKTAKITIRSREQELFIYLHGGQIVYAKCGETSGAEAIYEGASWCEGTWDVEATDENDLPRPNNTTDRCDILMETNRRLMVHRKQSLPAESGPK